MRRIRNPVYGYAVTWVRIPPSPPSTCLVRDRDSIDIVNRALVARFCVLGSELLRADRPTFAPFRAEVSGRECGEFGAKSLQFTLVERLAWISAQCLQTRQCCTAASRSCSGRSRCCFATIRQCEGLMLLTPRDASPRSGRRSPPCYVEARSAQGAVKVHRMPTEARTLSLASQRDRLSTGCECSDDLDRARHGEATSLSAISKREDQP